MNTFEEELVALINRWSLENASDTPDFILAKYMAGCLAVFNEAVRTREHWHRPQMPAVKP